MHTNNNIHAAADALAHAKHAETERNHDAAAAQASRDRIAGRVAALEGERQAIAARRASGHGDDDADGSRLALIALDLDGLASIRVRAETDLSAARHQAQEATRQVAFAQDALDRSADDNLLAALVANAVRLDGLLLSTLTEIEMIRKRRLIARHPYAPNRELADRLRILDLQRVA
jgi:hypothetical protein